MDIPNYVDYLQRKEERARINSRRAYIVSQMVERINIERLGTTWKPMSPRAVAILTSHLGISELDWLHHSALEYKEQKGSYSKFFFGSLKNK